MGVVFKLLKAGAINVIERIAVNGETHVLQRHESDARIEQLRDEWDDSLAGVITVHALTDHPTEPGILHAGDGGCRVRAKTEGDNPEPGYEFACTVEPVSIEESARRFLGINKGRKAVAKMAEYNVALTATEDWAHAIEDALTPLGLVVDNTPSFGNGHPGRVAAVASCEAAVRAAYRLSTSWSDASDHLAEVLGITRAAFGHFDRDTAAFAHNGDLIRATSRILLRGDNPTVLGVARNQARLTQKLGSKAPAVWMANAAALAADRATTPGSGGRPQYLAALIVHEFNKGLRDDARRLQNPGRIVIE